MAPVPGRRVLGWEGLQHPGDFAWRPDENPNRMIIKCPCGCGDVIGICVAPMEQLPGRPSPVWDWDGNLEKPTVTPSIRVVGSCGWHGFLTDGVFRSC